MITNQGRLVGADAKRAILIFLVMTVHSFAEGLGVGAAFSGPNGERRGLFISASLALHNIPEGLAVALAVIPKGETPLRGALYAIFSSLPQAIVAVPAFIFVDAVQPLQPMGLGAAAGAMIWVVFSDMLPEV